MRVQRVKKSATVVAGDRWHRMCAAEEVAHVVESHDDHHRAAQHVDGRQPGSGVRALPICHASSPRSRKMLTTTDVTQPPHGRLRTWVARR